MAKFQAPGIEGFFLLKFEYFQYRIFSIEQVAGEQGLANQQHFPYKFFKISNIQC